MLAKHLERRYVDYLLNGIKDSFRIGFSHSESDKNSLSSAKRNMHSTMDKAHIVSEYLEAEISRGTVLGPLAPEDVPEVHINWFGVISKSHQPGR